MDSCENENLRGTLDFIKKNEKGILEQMKKCSFNPNTDNSEKYEAQIEQAKEHVYNCKDIGGSIEDAGIKNVFIATYLYAGDQINKKISNEIRDKINSFIRTFNVPYNCVKKGGKLQIRKPKKSRNKKHFSRKSKKSYKKLCKKCPLRKKLKRKTKKMHGGVAFNEPVDINNKSYNLPPLNTYENDPQNTLTDSRLLPAPSFFGGKKRKSARRRKMKGGSLIGTDILTGLNTTMTNEALAFGTTGGTEFMAKTLNTEPISSGDAIVPKDTMVPLV